MKKINIVWVAIIALMVGVGLYGYYILTTLKSNQETTDQNGSLETAVARTGDLTILASGSGQIIPASEIDVDFAESGTITEILVQVGDQVQAGEVLARLQSDMTPAELAADITQAELAVIQAERNLADLYATAELETAQALIALEDAQQALEDLANIELEKATALLAIAQAENSIATAEMMLYIYNSSPSEEEIYTAYASLLFKQEDLDDLQKKLSDTLKTISGARNQSQRERAEGQLLQINVQIANQNIVVEDALYKLETIDESADPLDISLAEAQLATAQAQLESAQAELAEIQAGPKAGDVAMAGAQLEAAQAEWECLKDGPDPEDIARYEARLEKARNELIIAESKTTVLDLVATIDAMVIDLNIDVGDHLVVDTGSDETDTSNTQTTFEEEMFAAFFGGNAGGNNNSNSAAVVLADLSQPLLEVYIDETDLEKIGLGYPVEVTFDALADETFNGEIVEISPNLESVSNVQAVVTQVLLQPDSYAKPISLPINLTALVDVIAGETSGAVLIPVEALVEIGPEAYGVYVVDDGDPQLKTVSIGLMDFTSVEITQGVNAGDTVALGYEQTTGN